VASILSGLRTKVGTLETVDGIVWGMASTPDPALAREVQQVADATSYVFSASDMVSNVTEALQAWRNAANPEEQREQWLKYSEARRLVVGLMVEGFKRREEQNL